MDETLHATLTRWGDFYLITGGAASALTGLQFVVQTLIASDLRGSVSGQDPESGTAAFATPIIVHFALALLLSALLCIPWSGRDGLRATLGVLGAGALVYTAIVLRRTRRVRGYVPVLEDWVWHVVLPFVAYGAILLAAVRLDGAAEWPWFAIAAGTLILICVGIHNAWDTVTYLTLTALQREERDRQPAPPPPPSPRRDAPTPAPAPRGRRRR